MKSIKKGVEDPRNTGRNNETGHRPVPPAGPPPPMPPPNAPPPLAAAGSSFQKNVQGVHEYTRRAPSSSQNPYSQSTASPYSPQSEYSPHAPASKFASWQQGHL